MEFESLQRHDSKTIIQTKNDIISKHSHPCRIPGNILISLFFKYLAFFFPPDLIPTLEASGLLPGTVS